MSFDQIAWFPLCAGLTAAGLVLAFLAFRRRGVGAGLRITSWALLPMAAYLTGALQTLWRIGTAIVSFVTGLVLSPTVWAGVALTGLSVVLFMVSGVIRRRGWGRRASAGDAKAGPRAAAAAPAQSPVSAGAAPATQPLPAKQAQPAKQARPTADDDFSDIEDILKRRGIG
jgi:hypothetical protein